MSKQQQPLHEPMSIPEQFIEQHYCQEHVMRAMEWDEPTFWAAYVNGGVPRGVNLMPLVGVPLIVWPKRILDEWFTQGCPQEPGAAELLNEVLQSLKAACESEGVIFPDKAAEMN